MCLCIEDQTPMDQTFYLSSFIFVILFIKKREKQSISGEKLVKELGTALWGNYYM